MKNTTTKFINPFVNALASGSLAYNEKYMKSVQFINEKTGQITYLID